MVAPRVHNVADAAGPEQWFKSLPIVTQYWLGATAIVTIASNFGILPVKQMIFSWSRIYENFEVWRLFTCFCYAGPFHINTIFTVYMLAQFSRQYEAGGPFNTGAGGGTADYIFMLMIGTVLILVSKAAIASIIKLPNVFCRNLVFYVLYTWSKRHPTSQANIWGVPVPAIYLPFAYLALSVFMGGAYMDILQGMICAHVYYFLADVVPQVQGRDVLATPQFLIDYFGVGEYRPVTAAPVPPRPPTGAGVPDNAAQRGTGGGYNWGGGRTLGRD